MDSKTIVAKLVKKHQSYNPFIIADNLRISILYSNLNNTLGFFSKYKRSKFIHLNSNMSDQLKNFVCAHELGHAIMHSDINTPFLKAGTLFSTDKIEREANTFAVELLLPDHLLQDYSDCSMFHVAKTVGIPERLVQLKRK